MEVCGIQALKRAIKIIGSQVKTAEVVGVSQPSVSYIVNEAGAVPAEWCIPLERATNGEVTRHQLRPDIYPDDDRSDGSSQFPAGAPAE